jgi:hypothetical protein
MMKYVKGDVSIRDSLNKNVSQKRTGVTLPNGTGAGLTITCQLTSTICCPTCFSQLGHL